MTQSRGSAKAYTPPQSSDCTGRLSEILLECVKALAGAGDVEAACRFAGQACVALRASDPASARRFDVLLHRLTPALTW